LEAEMPEEPKIYHYTSIEALALILKSRKIRFSRLDGVDDVKESQSLHGIDFGKFFFVSCWTQKQEESIPQWHMYSADMRGVRIELPAYPFRKIVTPAGNHGSGILVAQNMTTPLSVDEMIGNGYFITPLFSNDFFCGPVDYVSDVPARYAEAIEQQEDGGLNINGLPKLPRFKSEDWAFQQEYRFHLFVLPTSQSENGGTESLFRGDVAKDIGTGLLNNVDPGIPFVDVPVAEEAIDNLAVRLGPLSTPGGRLCVEALLEKYAPNAKVEDSHLTGTVRARSG
jgi:hypothetical protein